MVELGKDNEREGPSASATVPMVLGLCRCKVAQPAEGLCLHFGKGLGLAQHSPQHAGASKPFVVSCTCLRCIYIGFIIFTSLNRSTRCSITYMKGPSLLGSKRLNSFFKKKQEIMSHPPLYLYLLLDLCKSTFHFCSPVLIAENTPAEKPDVRLCKGSPSCPNCWRGTWLWVPRSKRGPAWD